VASAERSSEHPLGEAIVRRRADRGVDGGRADAFQSVTGKGIERHVDGREVLVGNPGCSPTPASTPTSSRPATALSEAGKTPMLVAVDGAPAGVIAVADTVKDDSAAPSPRCSGSGSRS
jgi:P-type Cu+ transporter